MAQRHERTLARQMAVQVLYMSAITGTPVADYVAENAELPDEGHLPAYAVQLLQGVQEHQDSIDTKLAEVSENWSVERMPLVDHAILLLATYEMLNVDQVPVSVCINEAVELAKSFGCEDESARFANGILGRIARTYAADRLTEADLNDAAEYDDAAMYEDAVEYDNVAEYDDAAEYDNAARHEDAVEFGGSAECKDTTEHAEEITELLEG